MKKIIVKLQKILDKISYENKAVKQSLFLGIILFIAINILFSFAFSTYTSKTKLIFIPKNETFSNEIILKSIVELSKTQSFLNNAKKIDEKFFEKINFNAEMIKISVINDSYVFEVVSETKDASTSIILNKYITRNVINTASSYYDIKNNIDLRIVDGPILERKENNFLKSIAIMFLSFIFTLLIICIAEFLIKIIQKNIKTKRNILPANIFNEIPTENEFKNIEDIQDVPYVWQENKNNEEIETKKDISTAYQAKSAAPENLPIGDYDIYQIKDEAPNDLPITQDFFIENEEIESNDAIKKEPTQEELKERLNKLLRGEMV